MRHAVHAATAPALPGADAPGAAVPCDPAVATPVAATAVKGFPDVVSTAAPGTVAPAPSGATVLAFF